MRNTIAQHCLCGAAGGMWATRSSGDNKHTTVVCSQCGVERQPLEMTERELALWYQQEYPHREERHSVKDDVTTARKRLVLLDEAGGRSIVDVGCGNGAFVNEARRFGFDAVGIEVGDYAEGVAKEYIYKDSLFDVHLPTEETDIVTLHDVLEHFADPRKALKEIYRFMKPNGQLIVEVPRFGTKDAERHYRKVQHIWLWTESQIKTLLSSCGFSDFKISVPVPGKLRIDARRGPPSPRPVMLVPPGIGDTLWVLVKLQAWMAREGLDMVDVKVSHIEGTVQRCANFVRMFPFVHFAGYQTHETESGGAHSEIWAEAYRQKGRTWFPNHCGCDWFASYNGVTRMGYSLDEIDPDLKVNWDIPRWRSLEERNCTMMPDGPYFVSYYPPYGMYGHWLAEFPAGTIQETTRKVEARGWKNVLLGSEHDKTVLANTLTNEKSLNLLARTSTAQMMAILSKAQVVIGFPSGLTIAAVSLLRVPTVQLWNRFFNKRFWHNANSSAAYGNWYLPLDTNGLTPEAVNNAVSFVTGETGHAINEHGGNTPMDFLSRELKSAKASRPLSEHISATTPAPVTVVCVLKSGWNVPDEAMYVRNLAAGVKRNLKTPHEFVVVTNSQAFNTDKGDMRIVPMKHDWAGWYSKIEMFRPEVAPKGPTLFFDLDTVITGPLDGFLDTVRFPKGIYFVDDFYHPGNPETSMMFWTGMDVGAIYRTFEYAMRPAKSDAPYITGRALSLWRGLARADIQSRIGCLSYKVGIRDKGLDAPPPDTSVVCFHGVPRPHELDPSTPWMQRHFYGVQDRAGVVAQAGVELSPKRLLRRATGGSKRDFRVSEGQVTQ